MSYTLHQIPIFEEIKESKNILLAGAGGGYDIFSAEFNGQLSNYRNGLDNLRPKRQIPI